ncbi:phosphate ABC transporter permease PstA [Pedomonas mirosovicensis]|uniref:phosphate ABC transporter permease PstA n=1 Tax=Pedomonas mirosovicensis TaxID=2908641 RepID=UPI002168165B|nr:phosphate ABC transporter permease PstA [Pedomonas mirosovicensis]MCH8684330.1 phosphate ABC transporter permease PstA [Pedomonas mirosovicensis]
MNNAAMTSRPAEEETMQRPTDWKSPEMVARIRKRYRSEKLFRTMGLVALTFAGAFLAFLLFTMVRNGLPGFEATEVRLNVAYTEQSLGVSAADVKGPNGLETLRNADYGLLAGDALAAKLGIADPNEIMRAERMVSQATSTILRDHLLANPSLFGKTVPVWVPAASDFDMLRKGNIRRDAPEGVRRISDDMLAYFEKLEASGDVRTAFNTRFFTSADSRDPELASVWGATVGSLLTLFVTLLISFPIGVLTAVYLEEFAPKNRITDFIEVNINNLAAVPSIIFGLLGLAVFLGTFGMPRSAPLVGGLTLALMTLPTIVIASRVAIRAVPPSIRDAARGIGASPLQVVFHHVVPLSMPGILTGTIIGMARALGETAPLLMIGMRAFIVDVPRSLEDPATVLPVQVFLWSDSIERGFVEKTSAAILVLLVFLMLMNGLAIYLRQKFERRW